MTADQRPRASVPAMLELQAYADPVDPDDPDANFKTEVREWTRQDPLPALQQLSASTGVPVGALARYILARWTAEGSEALLAAGPRLVERMAAWLEHAEASGRDENRLAAYRRLQQVVAWLRLPLVGDPPAPEPAGEIRPAEPGDADAVAGLVTALGYPTDAAAAAQRLAALQQDPASCVLVAGALDTVHGVAAGHLRASLSHDSPSAELIALVVDPAVRGTGIGAGLVAKVETWARRAGAERITVTSALHRDEAHRFYRRLGYEQTGVRLGKALSVERW